MFYKKRLSNSKVLEQLMGPLPDNQDFLMIKNKTGYKNTNFYVSRLYDNNLNTLIKIEYKIGDSFIDNQTIEEKIFSANQQKTIQQTLIIKLDGPYKDLNWNTSNNVIVKITDLNILKEHIANAEV